MNFQKIMCETIVEENLFESPVSGDFKNIEDVEEINSLRDYLPLQTDISLSLSSLLISVTSMFVGVYFWRPQLASRNNRLIFEKCHQAHQDIEALTGHFDKIMLQPQKSKIFHSFIN